MKTHDHTQAKRDPSGRSVGAPETISLHSFLRRILINFISDIIPHSLTQSGDRSVSSMMQKGVPSPRWRFKLMGLDLLHNQKQKYKIFPSSSMISTGADSCGKNSKQRQYALVRVIVLRFSIFSPHS